MPTIARKDIPQFVRRCYDAWKKAGIQTRMEETERLKFYAGGDGQWRDAEIQKRRDSGRPWITINKCKPPVDQIEGDIRLNPPGPSVKPVGEVADAADPDIIAGLIRETEYRSSAVSAYSTAGKYVAASGCAYLELATEYVSDTSFAQQLRIDAIEDPAMVFFDPASRRLDRRDATWAGKIRMLSKEQYEATFGKRRVLEPAGVQIAAGWIQDALGIGGNMAEINEWTGMGKGPFYVVEFYLVETNPTKLRLYSNGISYFDDETRPDGIVPKGGEENTRIVPRRVVTKFVVDALEILDETEWLGDMIPIFPVLGPEVYIDGRLHRLSLIAGAMDSQRALNYVATTAAELTGALPKAPWIGPKGSFEDQRWESANSEMWAYLEYTPVFVTDETTGGQTLAPAPQRNMWEAPIQWLMMLGQWYSDNIKATTSIYDASLGREKGDQSGKAIEQLRSESNVANFSYADNLHRAIEVMYQQMCIIFPKILDGPRVVQIVRPDSQHETVRINQIFGEDGIDPQTGKKGKANNIALGQYSCRVVAGPNFQTRQDQALQMLLDAVKINPNILANPAVTAKLVRMIGQGNPEMEGIADIIAPNDSDSNPQQMAQQMQQMAAQNQQLIQAVQALQMEIKTQAPKLALEKYKADQDAAVKLAVAEIGAKNQAAARASADELATRQMHEEMAHDVAMAAQNQEHAQENMAVEQQRESLQANQETTE